MLKIRIIVVGKTKAPFLKEGEAFFLDRLRRYARVEWIEVKPSKMIKSRSIEEILTEEGEAMARRLDRGDYLVTLDRLGRQFDSEGLSRWLDKLSTSIRGWICFIIGGPLGVSKEILERSHKSLSLSKLTLTHEMSRLLVLEQLYRAFTILRGGRYHK
ncbi:MAG: 23S rRNA (pseudouridine(1915)-N(3))-methyltransferase RlmH [Pseudomonadota bacterium]